MRPDITPAAGLRPTGNSRSTVKGGQKTSRRWTRHDTPPSTRKPCTIAETDPYAAYLVSLHASGLYNRRYGWFGLSPVDWTKIGPHGRALLAGQRQFRAALVKTASPEVMEFEATWRNYMLLETFDYLSLLTCYGFHSTGCGPVPTVEGQWEQLSIRRLGTWAVELCPFPFAADELVVDVKCVDIEQARFDSDEDLREQVVSAHPEIRRTTYRAGVSRGCPAVRRN